MKHLIIISLVAVIQGCAHDPSAFEQDNALINKMNEAIAESNKLRTQALECQATAIETRKAMEACCGSQNQKIDRMFEKALTK